MHCDRSESDHVIFLACDWSAVTNPALSLTNGWLADSLLWSGQGAGVAAAVSVKVRDDNGIYWLGHKRLLVLSHKFDFFRRTYADSTV